VFTFYDDSKDKLSMETFALIFIAWAVGMGLALVGLTVEMFWYKCKASQPQSSLPMF
jgi:hypothetical protein